MHVTRDFSKLSIQEGLRVRGETQNYCNHRGITWYTVECRYRQSQRELGGKHFLPETSVGTFLQVTVKWALLSQHYRMAPSNSILLTFHLLA